MAEQSESPSSATTIEQTSKRLKLHQIISILMIVVGGVWTWTAISVDAESTIPIWILIIGIGWYFVTRIRIWWHHK